MIKFYYTRFRNDREDEYEKDELDYAIGLMKDHFYNGRSCAQMVVDFENKVIYTVTDNMLEDVLRERDDILGFEPNNFEIQVVD